MALIDKASLLMVPSTYEDGTLYNVLPSGNKAPDETGSHNGYDQTRADFTFSRGSNLSATRIGSDGLIEKGRENLLLQSNNFNTTWIKNSGGTFTSGQSGYDGTNDAWQFNVTTASNSGAWQNVSFSGVATFSAYFKKGTIDKIGFTNYAGTAYECWFDLTNGTIGQQTGDLIDAKIEAVGTDGWYRCSITDIASGTNYFQLKPSNAFSGTSTAGSIFIQDAQVEMGLVSTDYIESGSVSGTAGVLENTPRIDYSSGAGALLLEPQRTNLIPNSEYFGSGSGWSLLNNVSVGNFVLSPEGKMNATELIFDGSTGGRLERTISGLTAGADYSVSVYARVASGTQDVFFGSFEDTPAITLTTEWQRFEKTQPENDTNAYPRIRCEEAATIEIWGFQHEAGSHVSSYVPTYGSAVTRSADSCSVTGVSDVIGQTEGTIYGEIDFQQTESAARFIAIGDGTANNRISIFTNSSNDGFRVFVNNGGTTQVDSSIAVSKGIVKFALGYSNNDYALYVDGVSRITDTSASVPACSNVYLGRQEISLTNVLGSGIKQAVLFDERLSNSELADLTS